MAPVSGAVAAAVQRLREDLAGEATKTARQGADLAVLLEEHQRLTHERDRLRAAADAVQALHQPRLEDGFECDDDFCVVCIRGDGHSHEVCADCYGVWFDGEATGFWPCPTATALAPVVREEEAR